MATDLGAAGQLMIWRVTDAISDGRDVEIWVSGIATPIHVREVSEDGGCAILRSLDQRDYIVRLADIERVVTSPAAVPRGV